MIIDTDVERGELPTRRVPMGWLAFTALALLVVLSALVLFILNSPPQSFQTGRDIHIPMNSSVGKIGALLKENGYIRSTMLFKLIARSRAHEVTLQAGSYRFEDAYTTSALMGVLQKGESKSPSYAITFPEGFSVQDMRSYVDDVFPDAQTEGLAHYEGYLFPDTYLVSPEESFEDLVARMGQEYEEKIAPLRSRIESSGLSEHEVIVLASILEREANDETSMRTVSGILQNRLGENIPLQVDATFEYLLGKTSAELTMEDLQLNSPLNTYIHTGLTPVPIANPGLMAIEAVLDPIPSEYHFYLTDDNGNFHYAVNFDQHKANKARYLP